MDGFKKNIMDGLRRGVAVFGIAFGLGL